MNNIELLKDSGYDVEVRSNCVVLSTGTPENGETIELDNFNSSATSGTASHYRNGNESICGWEVIADKLYFLHREN